MKLTNVRRLLGRYRNEATGQEVNFHRGRQVGRSVDVTFYLRFGKRVLVSDAEQAGDWKRVQS